MARILGQVLVVEKQNTMERDGSIERRPPDHIYLCRYSKKLSRLSTDAVSTIGQGMKEKASFECRPVNH